MSATRPADARAHPSRAWLALVAGVAIAACRPTAGPDLRAREALLELRSRGSFDSALVAARAEWTRVQARSGAPRWMRVQARADVAALERIVALPDSGRVRFARLEAIAPRRVTTRDDWRTVIPALEAQLTARERVLGADHPDVADTRSALGRLEWAQGDATHARDHDEAALATRQKVFGDDSPAVAESYDQLGDDYKLAGMSYHRTLPLYRRALDIARRVYPRFSAEYATIVLDYANMCRWISRRDESMRHFDEACAIRVRLYGENSLPVAEVLSDRAVTHTKFGDFVSAARDARRALAILDRLGDPSGPELPLTLNTLGKALFRLDRPAEAMPYLRRAAEWQERRWSAARRDPGRAQMFQLAAWQDCACAALLTGDSTGAFDLQQRGLSRAIAERAFERGELSEPVTTPNLLDRTRRLLPDSTALVGWLASPVMNQVQYPFWGYVVRRDRPIRWVRFDAPSANEHDWVDEAMGRVAARMTAAAAWPAHLEPTPDLDTLSQRLWRLRFSRLEGELEGVRELLVVSPSVNYSAPLELAKDDRGRWLLDRFTISYLPSAFLFTANRERREPRIDPRHWRALLVGAPGGPAAADGAEPLRLADDEVRGIRARWPAADVLLGTEASEARITRLRDQQRLREYQLLHFAAHQRSDPIFARDAALVLAEADTRLRPGPYAEVDSTDGRLTADEVERWELHSRLAVLASCRSMGYRFTTGEGLLGLGHGMLTAGAHCVVGSLWNADDEATAFLIRTFYAQLLPSRGRGRTPAEALRVAKQAVRDHRTPDGHQPWRHPAYWSGFVVLGDPW